MFLKRTTLKLFNYITMSNISEYVNKKKSIVGVVNYS